MTTYIAHEQATPAHEPLTSKEGWRRFVDAADPSASIAPPADPSAAAPRRRLKTRLA